MLFTISFSVVPGIAASKLTFYLLLPLLMLIVMMMMMIMTFFNLFAFNVFFYYRYLFFMFFKEKEEIFKWIVHLRANFNSNSFKHLLHRMHFDMYVSLSLSLSLSLFPHFSTRLHSATQIVSFTVTYFPFNRTLKTLCCFAPIVSYILLLLFFAAFPYECLHKHMNTYERTCEYVCVCVKIF